MTTQTVEVANGVVMLEKTAGQADLVLADPPYNYGQQYAGYDDNKTEAQYWAWTTGWLEAARNALRPSGALWVFAPDEWVSDIDVHARRKLGFTKQNHVVWVFTFGQAAQKRFTRSKCHLLYLTKSKTKRTFNADALKVPSARQLVYGDKRAQSGGKLPDDTWMLLGSQMEPYMTPDTDAWLQSRVCGTFKEREKHSPNQLPVPIVRRIVEATTKPGDLVVDPFCGSGTTGVVCKLTGRAFRGYDVSSDAVKQARRRIAEAVAEIG